MVIKNKSVIIRYVDKLLRRKSPYTTGTLDQIARDYIRHKQKYLSLTNTYSTPFYIFDREKFRQNIKLFCQTFNAAIPVTPYYAMKANPHPYVIQEVIRAGLGVDVSSKREFEFALKEKSKKIIFTGPAKSSADIELAIQHVDKTILNIDSFRELRLAGEITLRRRKKLRCGVRVFTSEHGTWNKFGISLIELSQFWKEAKHYPFLQLEGIQVHMSFNEDPTPYVKVLQRLGTYLSQEFSNTQRNEIKWIDFGGGFWPEKIEGFYPWDTPEGTIATTIGDQYDQKIQFTQRYYIDSTTSLKEYANAIAQAINTFLTPIVSCQYFCEPGRILVYPAMHIILQVVDIKRDGVIITDGATNMIGWEKFETTYMPVINLSNPALTEIPVRMYGSLCTPNDMWGYYCYAKKITEGDVLLIPNQGAYVYTYAQEFIREIPPVYMMK